MASIYYRSLAGIQVQQSEATAARRTFAVEFPAYAPGTDEVVTVTVSKGGATPGATAGTTLTQIAGALYNLVLHATDIDTLGDLALVCAGSVDTTIYTGLQVVSHDPYADVAAILADTGTDGVKLAADAVDAAAIKADGATEIAAAVLNSLIATYKTTAGSLAAAVNDIRQAGLFGKKLADTSDNTVKVYDTNGSTVLTTVTTTEAGTQTTLTPSP